MNASRHVELIARAHSGAGVSVLHPMGFKTLRMRDTSQDTDQAQTVQFSARNVLLSRHGHVIDDSGTVILQAASHPAQLPSGRFQLSAAEPNAG